MASKLQMFQRGLILAALALFTGACATTSQFSGYVTASAEAERVVRDGGFSEEAAAQIAIVQNPDFNKGMLSPKAVRKIQQYSISCQRQIDAQLSGPGQSALGGAVPYGAAGAAGTGLGAKAAFAGASFSSYAQYGGIAYLGAGAINGLVTGSYSMAQAKGDCTRQFWEDVSRTDPDFRGTHVVIVHAGKAWGGSIPPALDRSVRLK